MEFFVTKELELPEALCFILLGLHMVYSGMSYRSKNFKEGVSLVVDSLPLCRSSKRVNSSVRLELSARCFIARFLACITDTCGRVF